MPQCDHLKGHVTYYTIVLYYVEFSLITKSKWVREIVWSKFAIQISLLLAIIIAFDFEGDFLLYPFL